MLNIINKKKIIIFDFDGTLIDTMDAHAKLAVECIVKHFKIQKTDAIKKYYYTSGIPFPNQLETIFPDKSSGNVRKRILCSQEYIQRKEREVYLNTQLFDDIIPFIKEMRRLGFFMIISSSTEEKIIKKILKKYKIYDSFVAVMGKERGSKENHITKLMDYKPSIIYFIGNSRSDVALSRLGIITVGRFDPINHDPLNKADLKKSGADYTCSSLIQLQNIFKEISVSLLKRYNTALQRYVYNINSGKK